MTGIGGNSPKETVKYILAHVFAPTFTTSVKWRGGVSETLIIRTVMGKSLVNAEIIVISFADAVLSKHRDLIKKPKEVDKLCLQWFHASRERISRQEKRFNSTA